MSGRPGVTGAGAKHAQLSSSRGVRVSALWPSPCAACGSGDGGDSGGEPVPSLDEPAAAAAAAASQRSWRALREHARGQGATSSLLLMESGC